MISKSAAAKITKLDTECSTVYFGVKRSRSWGTK